MSRDITQISLIVLSECVKRNKVCKYFIKGKNDQQQQDSKIRNKAFFTVQGVYHNYVNTCIKYKYLFVSLVAALFVGVLITKVYLPVVIMKAQLLFGMLSQDPKLDHFR